MTTDRVALSILTPSLNLRGDLAAAIASVANQGLTSVEHIVADGGSTDGTVDMLSGLRDSVIWSSGPDSGQSDALNHAASMARADWFGWLNADEFYLPGTLQRVLDTIARDDADVIYFDFVETDPDGSLIRLVPQHSFSSWLLRHHGCYIPSCATFVRRSVVDRAGGWDSSFKLMMDWDLWLRCLAVGARFLYRPFPAAGFRLRPDRMTVTQAGRYAGERERVHAAQGIRPIPLRGLAATRSVRGTLKALNGNTRRQHRVSRLKGQSLEWFYGSGEAEETCSRLSGM